MDSLKAYAEFITRHQDAVLDNLEPESIAVYAFLTKLAHTVTPAYPIYDEEIATAFAFRKPSAGTLDRRLAALLAFYEALRAAYATLITEGLLDGLIARFRTQFQPHAASLPDSKALDFIFWSTGKLLRRDAVPEAPNRVLRLQRP